jgi:hypothetical protein
MRNILCAAILFMVLLKTVQAATAENFRRACRGDYFAHCIGVRPGGGRIAACLGRHRSKLSPACARALGRGAHCLQDYRKFCPNVKPGGGALRACLNRHRKQLHPACAKAIAG